MKTEEIIKLISTSEKKTPVEVFLKGELNGMDFEGIRFFGNERFGVIFGEYDDVMRVIEKNGGSIEDFHVEVKARNSAVPMADLSKYKARVEPGAIIRDMVEIGEGAIVMMGAVVNIGAVIGRGTMIDMNSVIGGRVIVGDNCHVGAGAVLSGVIEPPSATPVIIEDNVLIGANAVILEGIRVGEGSVVAAGAVVIEDVPKHSVVAGVPAKIVKKVDEKTKSKTQIIEGLRNLGS